MRKGVKALVIRSLRTLEEQATWDQDGKDKALKAVRGSLWRQETETRVRTVVLR